MIHAELPDDDSVRSRLLLFELSSEGTAEARRRRCKIAAGERRGQLAHSSVDANRVCCAALEGGVAHQGGGEARGCRQMGNKSSKNFA